MAFGDVPEPKCVAGRTPGTGACVAAGGPAKQGGRVAVSLCAGSTDRTGEAMQE